MIRKRALKLWAVGITAAVAVAACGGGPGTTSEELAPDQTLRFPINQDIGTLDPAQLEALVDSGFAQNLFSGLLKLDDNLNMLPDIADKMPDVSPDGLTYTFTMKKNVKFSNGDAVTSKDVLYSWNRAAAGGGAYNSVFEAVKGYADVEKSKGTKTLTGLSAPDAYTVKAVLDKPAGFWLSELAALGPGWIVSEKAIKAGGEDKWWTTPAGLIGTGPFKMTARVPKQSIDFEPVANWWGGSSGALKKVHTEVIEDQTSAGKKYEQGGLDLIGYGDNKPTPEDVIRFKASSQLSSQFKLFPGVRSTWVGFGIEKGPFKGIEDGKLGRLAFSQAIDRNQLVDVACAHAITCSAATGGFIPKGLKGYLGDNADPNGFDKAKALENYKKWDPTGDKVKGLTYAYNPTSQNKLVFENLAAQWKANLGVDVKPEVVDRQVFFTARKKKTYTNTFRHSWSADYDHPQDWFSFLYTCGGGFNGSGYCNKQLDDLVSKADQKPLAQADADYKEAGKIVLRDALGAVIFYDSQPFFIKPYLRGVGANAFYNWRWTSAKILKH
jgi:ABC-type oligopeptide transport system substrate-binding subunit